MARAASENGNPVRGKAGGVIEATENYRLGRSPEDREFPPPPWDPEREELPPPPPGLLRPAGGAEKDRGAGATLGALGALGADRLKLLSGLREGCGVTVRGATLGGV